MTYLNERPWLIRSAISSCAVGDNHEMGITKEDISFSETILTCLKQVRSLNCAKFIFVLLLGIFGLYRRFFVHLTSGDQPL